MPKIEIKNLTKIFGSQPQQGLKLLEKGTKKMRYLKRRG